MGGEEESGNQGVRELQNGLDSGVWAAEKRHRTQTSAHSPVWLREGPAFLP